MELSPLLLIPTPKVLFPLFPLHILTLFASVEGQNFCLLHNVSMSLTCPIHSAPHLGRSPETTSLLLCCLLLVAYRIPRWGGHANSVIGVWNELVLLLCPAGTEQLEIT